MLGGSERPIGSFLFTGPTGVGKTELSKQLAKTLGLGGRSRKLGNASEKARAAVTWRIRSAIKKIQSAHPRLGIHLSNSIQTGIFCVYAPESDMDWEV